MLSASDCPNAGFSVHGRIQWNVPGISFAQAVQAFSTAQHQLRTVQQHNQQERGVFRNSISSHHPYPDPPADPPHLARPYAPTAPLKPPTLSITLPTLPATPLHASLTPSSASSLFSFRI
jgi:hypothetical protein